MYEAVVIAFILCEYFLLPVALIWGWVRFAQSQLREDAFSRIATLSFSLASVSALLGVGTMIYARAIGGFPFYDPLLLSIYRWGFFLSLAGLLSSLAGVWKPGPLRWLAPACAFGTLVYWVGMASTE